MDELPTAKETPRYQTYLVTCWQERDEVVGTAVWRFRLETPRDGRRRIFTTLEEVISIIETELHKKTRLV
jgi:hypothetical protein